LLLTIISIQVNPRSYKVEVITYCLNDDGIIPEAHQADIISTVLYDRAFGCESPKNLCRNMTSNFNDKLKVVVDMIKK
jgi:hypothetical protein